MDLRTGCAYWLIRNGLLATYPRLTRDETADVAIIGAGVTGAAAAYFLTTAGLDVVVVDRRDVASGSTAAATGLLLYETDTSLSDLAGLVGLDAAVRSYQIGRDVIDRIEELCETVGDPCGFARRPSLYLASSGRDVATLSKEHALRKTHGFDVDLLSEDAVFARFGVRATAALYSPRQGEIDCFRFTHRLLAAAVQGGARVYDRTTVTTLARAAGRVELVTVAGVIRARNVICAAGYEASDSLDRNIANLNSTWACATEPLDQQPVWPESCLIWETARPYFYMRTTDDGRVLLGGEDSRFSRRHEQRRLLEKKTKRLFTRFHAMFPDLRAEPAYSWAGVFSETPDGLPFVGGQAAGSNVHYALGYGGNGITFGVAAAEMLRDELTGAANPDAHVFAFTRATRRGRAGMPLAAEAPRSGEP